MGGGTKSPFQTANHCLMESEMVFGKIVSEFPPLDSDSDDEDDDESDDSPDSSEDSNSDSDCDDTGDDESESGGDENDEDEVDNRATPRKADNPAIPAPPPPPPQNPREALKHLTKGKEIMHLEENLA
jgi:hypothetical protein